MANDVFVFTAQTDARPCPVCGAQLDAATGVSSDPADPRPELAIGNVTACAYCGSILTVTTIGLRLATDADLANVDPRLKLLLFEFSARFGRDRPT